MSVISYARHKDMAARSSQELMGICKGIIADGNVCQREADFLLRWLQNNEDAACIYPGCMLAERLVEIFEDGKMDENEAKELLDLLQNLAGDKDVADGTEHRSTTFGFDDPPPEITFVDDYFCLTGVFEYGMREEVEKILKQIGAHIKKNIVKKVPLYLVVGTFCTEEWKFSNYGRKLEQAMALRKDGYEIAIVSEAHMFDELEKHGFIAR